MKQERIEYKYDKPLALCADHAGFALKEHLIYILKEQNIPYKDFGTYSSDSMDYADVAHPLAQAIEERECSVGVAICGSGNGINMTVNKHKGVRSALCWTEEIAGLARQHNDANVLALPARFILPDLAYRMLKIFIETSFDGGRHEQRVRKISCSC